MHLNGSINTLGLLNHQGFIRYFANTSWLFAEQIIRMVTGLFVGIWVARYLGPNQFGIYSYVLAFVTLFSAFSKLGLDVIVVREIVNHPENQIEYMSTTFWLKFFGAIPTIGLLLLAAKFTNNDETVNFYIFLISLGLIFQSFEVVDFFFQAKVLIKYVSFCKITQITISTILKIFFLCIHAKLIAFVIVALLDYFFLATLYWYAYRYSKMENFLNHFFPLRAKELLKSSWPLILSGVAVLVYMRIDQIMIKEMLGEREIGLYAIAVKLSEAFYIFPTIITASLFPAILNARNHSKELFFSRLKQLYTLLFWISLSIALPITFLSDWIVSVIYGSQYIEAGPILSIHIWAGIAVGFLLSSGKFLVAENLTRYTFERNFLGAVANISLNLLLIPRFGLKGAAYSLLFSFFFSGLLYDLLKPKLRLMFFMKIKSIFSWDTISD